MTDDIWQDKAVFIKGFWDWVPDKWAAIGWNNDYRDTIINKTTDPFIAVIYVTYNSGAAKEILGKIVGFYLVSHEKGHRNQFIAPEYHARFPEKWTKALRAVRAFSFLPEDLLDVYDFDPNIYKAAQPTANWGKLLTLEQVEQLKYRPYVEVPVYGGPSVVGEIIHFPSSEMNRVKAGPVNRSGYVVGGEPVDTEKELYSLIMKGETKGFLGEMSELKIYKIGLSISPSVRLSCFQRALPKTIPEGRIKWELHRSTRLDKNPAYPIFEAAVQGENAMKNYLSKHAQWLGGEFYAATEEHFERAWKLGHEAALNFIATGAKVELS